MHYCPVYFNFHNNYVKWLSKLFKVTQQVNNFIHIILYCIKNGEFKEPIKRTYRMMDGIGSQKGEGLMMLVQEGLS
jgi:hypothetical protein